MALQMPFTFHAFRPKAVNEWLQLAGLLARSLLITFPLQKMQQWFEDSTEVGNENSMSNS